MPTSKVASGQSGFSLMELMVAMVVTLIVTGAVYGLLAGGNNAFKREPEMMERQQNIRIGMDLIMRDLQSVGAGMPAFVQAFSRGLNDCGGTVKAPPCDNIPNTHATDPWVPGIGNGGTDDIQALGNPGNFDGESTCHYPGGKAANVRLVAGQTGVAENTVMLVFMADGTWVLANANDTDGKNNTKAGQCESEPHAQIGFNSGAQDTTNLNKPGGLCADEAVGTAAGNDECEPIMIGRGEMIGYAVRYDTDGVPNLYRRSTGGLTTDFFSGGGWQQVARGIEDMQVQYRHLDVVAPGAPMVPGPWEDQPRQVAGCNPADPNADCCDPNCYTATEWEALTLGSTEAVPLGCQQPMSTPEDPNPCVQPTDTGYSRLVTEVRVTLSSRAENTRIQGVTQNTLAGTRLRGSLTQTMSPRATLFAMTRRPTGAPGCVDCGPVWR